MANKTWLKKAETFCDSQTGIGGCPRVRCAKPKDVECRAGTCQFVE